MEAPPAVLDLLQPGWRRSNLGADAFWAGVACVLACCAHAPGHSHLVWARHPFWAGLLTAR